MNMEETHIAIVPTPGVGHLIPLTELARRLAELNISVTFLIPNDVTSPPTKSQLSLLQSLPSSISHLFLPPVDVSDVPGDAPIEARISLTLARSIPAIRDSLRVLLDSTRLVALVADLMGTTIFDLAQEHGILPYLFFLTTALGLCLAFSIRKLDQMHTCEFRDLPEPVQIIPGSVLVQGSDLPDPMMDREGEIYKNLLKVVDQYGRAAGILVNSFIDLEPGPLKYLMEGGRGNNIPPVYPIGPVINYGLMNEPDGSGCLKWLDEQPSGSVLYVSFGSGGTLSHEQLVELALGLEMSGQRFLWVCRSPHDKLASATYFSEQSTNDPREYLPNGFLERTNGVGFVVPSWAPQLRILAHKSVGGFLTHCGWNSVVESVAHGVPSIAWPLYAEQRFNAVLLSEEFKVAFRVKPDANGLVGQDQIANYAHCLIQGEDGKVLRENMKALKSASERSLDENGMSKQSLAKVAQVWKDHKSTKCVLAEST